jgi:GH18 family chitinase
LKLVRSKLPSGKTLSIAAPASFWYLKQFPIKEIADVVDYIIYMTYDLHGQWDAENTFSKYVGPLVVPSPKALQADGGCWAVPDATQGTVSGPMSTSPRRTTLSP